MVDTYLQTTEYIFLSHFLLLHENNILKILRFKTVKFGSHLRKDKGEAKEE